MNSSYSISEVCLPFKKLLDTSYDNFWRPPTIDRFSHDKADWGNMNSSVKKRFKSILRCFTNMEVEIVDDVHYLTDLLQNLLPKSINKELQIVYTLINWQEAIEGIHLQTYLLIDQVLEQDIDDDNINYIDQKVSLIADMRSAPTNTLKDISIAIVSMICNEGLIFQSLFSAFFVAKSRGVLIETYTQNSYVLRDELCHLVTFCKLYLMLVDRDIIPKLSQQEIESIIDKYVMVDNKCAQMLLQNPTPDDKEFFMEYTADNCLLYSKYIADNILKVLRYDPLYGITSHTYDFMNQLQLNTLGSFFDVQVTDYSYDVDYDYNTESDPDYD